MWYFADNFRRFYCEFEGGLLQIDTRSARSANVEPCRFVSVCDKLSLRNVLCNYDEAELCQFGKNGLYVSIAKVLKYFSYEGDVAGRKFVGDDIDHLEFDIEVRKALLVTVNQFRDEIRSNVAAAMRPDSLSHLKITAAEIASIGRSWEAGQKRLDCFKIGFDDLRIAAAMTGIEVVCPPHILSL